MRRFIAAAGAAAAIVVAIPASGQAAQLPSRPAATASAAAGTPASSGVHNVGVGAVFTAKVPATAESMGPARLAGPTLRRSGSWSLSRCSANVSFTVAYQTCLKAWGSGAYGNYINYVQGKFATFHSGKFWCKWTIKGRNADGKSWWAWGPKNPFTCGFPNWELVPWRGDTGKLHVGRYIQYGTRLWFILYRWSGGRWVDVRSASFIVY
jgi:hypothetical protein